MRKKKAAAVPADQYRFSSKELEAFAGLESEAESIPETDTAMINALNWQKLGMIRLICVLRELNGNWKLAEDDMGLVRVEKVEVIQ